MSDTNDVEITLTVDKDHVKAMRTSDQAERTGRLDLDEQRREVIGLFQEWLHESGESNQSKKITRRRELEVLGKMLVASLINGDVLSFFESNLTDVRTRVQGLTSAPARPSLRLQLSFSDAVADLAHLPWEFMYYAPRNGRAFFLATDQDIVLSRYMPLREGRQLLGPGQSPLRVLIVVSQPSGLIKVTATPTIEAIRKLTAEQRVEVHLLDRPTIDNLLEGLEDTKPHVLHFMGHGRFNRDEKQGETALLYDDDSPRWVSDSDFAEYFSQMHAVPKLAFLHQCDGGQVDFTVDFAGLAPKLMLAGVQAVIAMQYPITNRAAIVFSRAFYNELTKGHAVDRAVQRGRYQVTLDDAATYGSRVFGTPVLYMRSRNSVIFPVAGD